MIKFNKRILIKLSIIAIIIILGFIFAFSGIYFNFTSASMPCGIYQKINKIPQKGDLAIACLSDPVASLALERKYIPKGRCPDGVMPVLKEIIGGEGDIIRINDYVLLINDIPFKKYVISKYDSLGRDLKRFYADEYTIGLGEYWLMSDYKENSWDSRYWGAVGIKSVVKPVLIFN